MDGGPVSGFAAVDDPASCRHPLDVARMQHAARTQIVAMFERSGEDEGYGLEAAVRVFVEVALWFDEVLDQQDEW